MFKFNQSQVTGSNELLILSIPNEDMTAEESWNRLVESTQKSNACLSFNFRFNIPELKVGTLDQLVGLIDDLHKTDDMAERVCRKIVSYFETVLGQEKDSLSENLVVGSNRDPFTYVTKFKWDDARFPTRLPLQSLEAMILKRIGQIESELKSRSTTFDAVNQQIQAESKAQQGNLLTKDVSDFVKASDFILGSESMKTCLVCVNRGSYQTWYDSYETLSTMVVPRSTKLIAEDNDYGLYTVVIFRKIEDSFVYACRQKGFFVKPFEYDNDSITNQAKKRKELELQRSRLFGPLIRWLKVNFSESFIDWLHVKALRVYVESVLRYGLPINFQAYVLQPNVKTKKKLNAVLDKLYSSMGHGPPTLSSNDHKNEDYDDGIEDYKPYVLFTLNLDFTRKHSS
ncbi:hypothetical protein GJ496_006451 [Pomphorhynchus laevis]|nr:hypothetical protein GJ496_006451 [Pomphorhynchus laevis]